MAEGFDNGVSLLRRAGTEPRLLVCAHVVDGHAAQALAIGNPSRRRHKTVAVADPMLDLLVGGRLLVHQHTFGSSRGRHSRSSGRSITHRPPCSTQCPGRRLSVVLVSTYGFRSCFFLAEYFLQVRLRPLFMRIRRSFEKNRTLQSCAAYEMDSDC